MEEEKKWEVTYTKHVKQKRKVFQDGFLHLLSTNKVVLYDESEQMLDSKFLMKGEVLKSGDSLTFSSFLVDIGGPLSSPECILLPNPKSESTSEKTRLPHQHKLRNCFANRKPYNAARTSTSINLSPSRTIIREFKKNEELKYSVQRSPTSTTASSYKEWEVLYTTQVTQKAKTYHDGFISLIFCGSQGRQVVLYDSNKTHIDKRFLRKDEVICSGKSLTFEAHFADIGDAIENSEDVANVKTQEIRNYKTQQFESGQLYRDSSSENLLSKSRRCQLPAQQNHVRSDHAVRKEFKTNRELKNAVQQSQTIIVPSSDEEWEVQYTTQIMQKDKKYHDGFIRLIICGSQGRQVILYDSSKTQIYKRLLKKDDNIRSGEALTFEAYLINVGDAVRSNENGKQEIRNCKTGQREIEDLMPKPQRCMLPAKQNHVRAKNAVAKGQAQYDDSLNHPDSNFSGLRIDPLKQTKTVPSHMPTRDAHRILSFLKKPVAQENIFAAEKLTPNKCPSRFREVVQNDFDSRTIEGTRQLDPHEMIMDTLLCNNTANGASTRKGHEGIVFQSPHKGELLLESVTNNTQQASVVQGQTPLHQLTGGASFVESSPSLSSETETDQQCGAKLPDADSSNMGRTSSTTPRRLFSNWSRMNVIKNDLNATNSEAALDCPSFDLGI